MLDYECSRNPHEMRRTTIRSFLDKNTVVYLDEADYKEQVDELAKESYCNDESILKPDYSGELRLVEQIAFVAPMIRMSEVQTKGGGKSYSYYFMPESAVPLMHCAHTMEIAVVFNHPEETLISGRKFDETFEKIMRRMWIQFAKTGNPSLTEDISPDGKAYEWPLYDLENRQVMALDEFNIRPEKEADLKIVDWYRTMFLTNYYFI